MVNTLTDTSSEWAKEAHRFYDTEYKDPFENSQADVISVTEKNVKFVVATEAEDTINITYNKIVKQHFLSLKVGDNEFSIWVTKDDLRKLMAVLGEVIEYEDENQKEI